MGHRDHQQWAADNYKYLYSFAQRKINDPDLIRDLIQETFLVALESYPKFEQRSSDKTWLTAILKHKIFKFYRHKAIVERNLAGKLCFNTTREDSRAAVNYEGHLLNKEFILALNNFVNTFPATWRQLYSLKYEQDFTSKEICEKLKLTPNNYWVVHHRLKASLRRWYLQHWN
ncbi:RNA polymerase sigma factor [Mucilaginibacter terrae]|uniref:RNA polymerase sigma factor (Sigma-70 family) n=1 Tax=Mucilaginibacter terrae TaxID=1955052 RepID=A0ABU3GQH7_9SPHI|nr:sigma-70 family RNA polymerase sigma factor [Mucilaginibacter terrae]MDT3401197.1 RNA polymerase sigma factor (sigma-70 family) [Mucilaginibacter terrae]